MRIDVRLTRADAPRRAPVRLSGLPTVALAVTLGAMTLGLTPTASADPDRRPPTRAQVEQAEQRVVDTTREVGAIQAALLLANQRLEAAAVEAAIASEAYNGAMWRLGQAREELRVARAELIEVRRSLAVQRRAIGALVAASYQQGSQLTALSALMSADGPEGVLDHYATFQGAADSLDADYQRYAAGESLAEVFEERAEDARIEQERMAQAARLAREAASVAAEAAQVAATSIAAEKDTLIRELAAAQDISVRLARERQTALEERAQARAAERARLAAEQAADAAAREQARQERARRRAQREQARADRERRTTRAADRREPPTPRPERTTAPTITHPPASPPPASAPPPPPQAPRGSGGADRAIAFAKAQVGDPYVWGAAGPDAWDCSGLMLEAWGQSGVSLPHYSVAQYYAGTPVSASDLRPGDLVFWGTTNDPGSIFHVALYIGGGQIVHAPRTGRAVSIDSLYYWTPPNFFARV